MTTPRAHALYRFYDTDGALLYVGITLDPGARWNNGPQPSLDGHDEIMLELVGDPFAAAWGIDATHMPDDCHDVCVKNGIYAIYYPHLWNRGKSFYTCAQGHTWTCWWGHEKTGAAPQWYGNPAQVLNLDEEDTQ